MAVSWLLAMADCFSLHTWMNFPQINASVPADSIWSSVQARDRPMTVSFHTLNDFRGSRLAMSPVFSSLYGLPAHWTSRACPFRRKTIKS